MYEPECLFKDGTPCPYLRTLDFLEFKTLKKARRFMRKYFKQTVAEESCEWLETNHNSFGVTGQWLVRIERGTRIREAMPIK